jgi:hypothetical protein
VGFIRRLNHRLGRVLVTLAAAACLFGAPAGLLAADPPNEADSPLADVADKVLGQGLPSMSGKVKKVELGSSGATVTLSAGDEIEIDLSGLTGAGGGTNYLGIGMLLFGLSVATRLLSTLSRLTRPFAGRRRRYDE